MQSPRWIHFKHSLCMSVAVLTALIMLVHDITTNNIESSVLEFPPAFQTADNGNQMGFRDVSASHTSDSHTNNSSEAPLPEPTCPVRLQCAISRALPYLSGIGDGTVGFVHVGGGSLMDHQSVQKRFRLPVRANPGRDLLAEMSVLRL